jgi:hypothetical protein
MPAEAGIQVLLPPYRSWIPAFAGMTENSLISTFSPSLQSRLAQPPIGSSLAKLLEKPFSL